MNFNPIFLIKLYRHTLLLSLVWGIGTSLTPSAFAEDNNISSIVQRLKEWQILTAPKATNFSALRYANFLQQKPEWPLQDRILWRYQHALLQENDSNKLQQLCPRIPLTQLPVFIKCAPFLNNISRQSQARRFWISSLITTQSEQRFLQNNNFSPTSDDQWKRYVHLEKLGLKNSAQQQINRLTPFLKSLAQARFANRFNTPDADEQFTHSAQPYNATLLLLRLKYLRLHNRYDEALQLWRQNGLQTERHISSTQRTSWVLERLALARAFLRSPEIQNASQVSSLIAPHSSSVSSIADKEERLLGGYIALILNHDPYHAARLFKPLTTASSLSAQAAGWYWRARCAEILQQQTQTRALYEKASTFPTTFYGQLALAHITKTPFLSSLNRSPLFTNALRKRLSHVPTITPGPITRSDLSEAAHLLATQGDIKNATFFLVFLQAKTEDVAAQKSISDLAQSLHILHPSIIAARNLAQQGIAFFPEGYPTPPQQYPDNNSLPKGLISALIRQESGGNPYVISPRQALGLMQLLLGTAKLTARHNNLPTSTITAQNLMDPQLNIQLGQLYLNELMQRFDHTLPYVLAAYNAGPANIHLWNNMPVSPFIENTVPSQSEDRLLHWILTIPYQETRFYIQHIETDMSLYTLPSTQQ